MGKIINGTEHAAAIRAEVAKKAIGKDLKLAVILVGDNPASIVYINMKKKACEEVGIGFELHKLPADIPESELIARIAMLNSSTEVTGILVQQPFPAHIDKHTILSYIAPPKDVDCLNPYNVGLAMVGQGELLPCTPAGCMELLQREGIELEGKHAVVVGRSDIVGKPLALMLLAKNATVTLCHSRTKNLAEECRRADILVAAIGSPRFVTADMVKEGAVVLDVGVNRLEGKKVCGDVDFDNVIDKVSYITPVPKGVGPMTVATLMKNIITAWELQKGVC
ncbi:MAG: bifunctional 5,10-methylenetetrahydrofolate dehydrogenase/5,10-methenyltetrahydrofolate cyclohydrolase [Defluviitaleaceae bacterium]|nr:bifunctional 5,10-methylenetetrahydrofolate dehydrogenase/5,10-methenyltetrahydrofolate cyclohydrolase [Defluviitaleaceae bacterium]